MILAGLTFGSPDWRWAATALLAVALIAVWRGAAVYRQRGGWSSLAVAGKVLAMLLIALCLTEPLWSSVRTRPGANLFLILADNSASLTICDANASQSRGEEMKSLLTGRERNWLTRLEQEFDVRRFAVGSRLEPISDFHKLKFEEPHTGLFLALRQLTQRFAERPVAGVLLLTDGVATDERSRGWTGDGLPPIYPLVLGEPSGLKDLSVDQVAVNLTAFEDAPVTITAEIHQQGFSGREVAAQILDEKQAVVKEETLQLPDDNRGTSVRFQIRPAQPGLSFYTLKVTPRESTEQEATEANNVRRIVVERGSGPYRVLYISGRPNWEFKFLNRALAADDQVKLTALIRIAKREPKFDWRGRGGESSNPLFRGFDGIDAETERFDQPVIVRLNTKDGQELRDGFPKTAAELFPFHAVIIDDLEAEFFTTVQMELLERYVSERGGSLLMLGGQESFGSGGYRRTPLARVLPVTLDETPAATAGLRWKWNLTRDGSLQPWARLRSTEEEETRRLNAWPAFRTLNTVGREKPGATVIAEAIDQTGAARPALVAQRYGEGRSAAVLIGDLWRAQLQLKDDERKQDDPAKAWRQMIRWLIADVPDRIELRALPVEDDPAVTRLEMRIKSPDFQPQDNSSVIATVRLPDGSTLKLPSEPSLAEAGLYDAVVASQQPGNYHTSVEVTDSDGALTGSSATGFVQDPIAQEFRRVAPDAEWLKELAEKTRGEVLTPDRLENFVRSLTRRPAPITEATTSPLWQHPLVLALIVLGLCTEWGLRRWRGLP
jgi:uncharacterized membrane protein